MKRTFRVRYLVSGAVLFAGGLYLPLGSWLQERAEQAPASSVAIPVAPEAPVSEGSIPRTSRPTRIRIGQIGVDAEVIPVGLTPEGAMEAPTGAWGDRVWRQGFWFRYGSRPGEPGVVTIAGHVSGGSGSVFRHLEQVRVGSVVAITDESGFARRYRVSGRRTISASRASDPIILKEVFGSAAVSPGRPHREAPRLMLVTCAGRLDGGGYDRRLIVTALPVDGG